MKIADSNHFQRAKELLTEWAYGLAMQTWTLDEWVQCCLCDDCSEGEPN